MLMCVYNGAPRLPETLRCLSRQRLPAGVPWEVIFVDNASSDGSAELAQQLWQEFGNSAPLRLSLESRPGYKVAMERAISQVQYRYACIVDDDNRLDSDYLRIGLEVLEQNPMTGILGGRNTATFDGEAPAWFSAFQHCYAVGQPLNRIGGGFTPLPDGNVGRNVLWGAGMFVRTAVWTKLHEAGFKSLFTGRQGEKNLTAGEDDELCYATQLLGYEVWYSSHLHLQHHMPAGRLTEDYRNRLFYASARSTTRLNAYRNALWGKDGGAAVESNLLKDIGYNLLGVAKNVLSPAFLGAWFTGDYLKRMNQWHSLSVATDAVVHYKRIKTYYQRVLQLKQQLASHITPNQPQHV